MTYLSQVDHQGTTDTTPMNKMFLRLGPYPTQVNRIAEAFQHAILLLNPDPFAK